MKRHPALVPLSREHHRVLLLAQGLRADGPPTLRAVLPAAASERAAHALAQWRAEIEPHFRFEEERLLPALEGHDAALDAEVARVRREHADIRALVARVEAGDALEASLEALGEALVAHVRAEERGLFEVAQRVLGAEGLAERLRHG
jgi:iron-sulfur cluster repair protein YtfE (RIC family)